MIGKNNPFNIRRSGSKWQGLTGYRRGFCQFDSLDNGVRAAAIIIFRTYYNRGFTSIRQILYRFAPPCENDTESYVKYMSGQVYCPPNIPVPASLRARFLFCMAYFESKTTVSYDLIVNVLKRLDLYEE